MATFRRGLKYDSDWHGPWIGAVNDDRLETANQRYRAEVDVPEGCRDAVIFVASLGYHELFVNGERIGEGVLAPATSDLLQRVNYVAYDVTKQLKPGRNVIGVALGAGWTLYQGHGWSDSAVARWPKRPALRLQGYFFDEHAGQLGDFHADETWKTHGDEIQPTGKWGFRDFGGERLVVDQSLADWGSVGYDASAWHATTVRPSADHLKLVPQSVESNSARRAVRAVKITRQAEGEFRVELESMATGFIDASLVGEPHAEVVIEASDRPEAACVYGQRQTLRLSAQGNGRFRNRFNYVNCQWLTIRGPVETPALDDVAVWQVSTDLKRVGHFRCSQDIHNRIYETALRTFECLNLGGYVVDCAHRERLGYGGDGHATAALALPNYDCGAFYRKWLRDWVDVQQADGNVTFSAPFYGGGGGPAWSGLLVHAAYEHYLRYGDVRVLNETYPAIKKWLAFLGTRVKGGLLLRYDGPRDFVEPEWSFLGDWVYPGHDQSPNNATDETLFFNNCYYAFALRRAALIADALGNKKDAAEYRLRADDVSRAICERWRDDKSRRFKHDRQACLAIAYVAQVVPPQQTDDLLQQLEESIHAANDHIDAGIGGTHFLLQALQEADRPELGLLVAGQPDYPGWGKMLADGATSFWEQWDGIHSRCHSSYLGIGGWYIESVVGIRPDPQNPGYGNVIYSPGLDCRLDWAEGNIKTVRGTASLRWDRDDSRVNLRLKVPAFSTGLLRVDSKYHVRNTSGDANLKQSDIAADDQGGMETYHLAPGKYELVVEE